MDLQTGWDLEQEEHVEQLDRLVESEEPYLLTGGTVVYRVLETSEHLESKAGSRRGGIPEEARFVPLAAGVQVL